MIDPQTAAEAAERVQAFVELVDANGGPPDGWALSHVSDANGTRRAELTFADLVALLAERARMAAELEQVRGRRAATQHPIVAELMSLTPEQAAARRCAWCGSNPLMAGLGCVCIANCGDRNCKWLPGHGLTDAEAARYEVALARREAHRAAETTATRPAGGFTGAPKGQRLSTPENGPRRPAQGDSAKGNAR